MLSTYTMLQGGDVYRCERQISMIKKYLRQKYTFFDELLSFLISACCMPVGLNFFRKMLNLTHTIPPWKSDQGVLFQGNANVTNQQIRFVPHNTFAELWERRWPEIFELEYQTLNENESTVPNPEKMPRNLTYTLELLSGCFILFWDKVEDSIKAKYSSDSRNWPEELNFARIIRNSFAHGNKFEIRNQSSPIITWKGISVDYSVNGQMVLFGPVGVADIIILMEEVDSLL